MYTTFTTEKGNTYRMGVDYIPVDYIPVTIVTNITSNLSEVMSTPSRRTIEVKNTTPPTFWHKVFGLPNTKKVKEVKREISVTETSTFANGTKVVLKNNKTIWF